jgi:S-adenosylmethionine uptake transporter
MSIFSNSSHENPINGILLLVFALFLFSLQDVVIKYFSDQYSVLQIVFIRGVIAVGLMWWYARLISESRQLASRRPWLALSRGFLGFCSYTTYYLAVASLPLAEVVAIVFSAPLFVTAMSALLLREKVGLRRWSAVIAGFIGVLIIVGPSGEFANLAVILAFCASITYASQTIITRYLGSHDTPLSIAFNALIVFTGASALISLMMVGGIISISSTHPSLVFFARDWVIPEMFDLSLMIFLGLNGAIAFYCMSKAYCVAPASTIAPFEFTYVVWAVVFGYLFWSEIPRTTTLVGLTILIGSSIYIWTRERNLQGQGLNRKRIETTELAQQSI